MATRNSNRAPQNRTQSFYGRSKNAPASLQLSTRGRKSQPLRDQYNITSSATGSERTNSTRALKPRVWSEYDGGFDGYRHGMRLNDAKPTPMYSSSGDETGTGEEGDETEGMGLRRRGDDVLLSLHEAKDSGRRQIMDSTSPGMTFDQFYSAQPTQMQPRHQISGDQDVIALLQSQQASLDKVLQGQRKLERRQEQIEETLLDLQSKVAQHATPSSSSPESSSGKKRKRLVTRTLSSKVYSVHEHIEKKFDVSETLSSSHNKEVQSQILKEITNVPNAASKFPEPTVKVAIKRCYENLRRSHLENQPGKADFSKQQGLSRKYRSRRERKFKRRSAAVTKVEFEKYWSKLDLSYMTEESDDPDNPNGIVEHKIPWRSKKLDNFVALLDERLTRRNDSPIGLVAKKVRKIGSPSESLPPTNAPVWAVDAGSENDPPNDHEGETAAN